MTASQSGVFSTQQFTDAGAPLAAGRLYTFAQGTTTQKTAYTDAAGLVPHTYTSDGTGGLYLALNARGELPAPLYLTAGTYDISLKRADGSTVWTRAADGIVSMLSAPGGAGLIGFVATGVGAVAVSVQSKLREFLSVGDFGPIGNGSAIDQSAVAAAVSAAFAAGADLWWPANYLTNANIPNIHSVRHFGPGSVLRGSDVFYPAPREGQENILYVSASGIIGNDGLSAGTPTTLQGAFNILMAHNYLEGNWRVRLAAGNYTGAARLGRANESETTPNSDSYKNNNVKSKNFIIIEGPDVGYNPTSNPWPTPTALFDGAEAAAIGIGAYGVSILVKNLKFSNYNGSTSAGGIIGDGCQIRTENVHTSGCYYGISNFRGLLEVRGGWIYGSPTKQWTGIRSMFLNKHEIGSQNAGGIGQGPKITFCNFGMLVQEGGTGHSDFVQYEDCQDAIRVTVNSRVNYNSSDFKRCDRAVRVDFNSVVYGNGANYNLGTAGACTELVVIQKGGVDGYRDSYANTAICTDYLTTSTTVTGTTTTTVILAKTLARGRFAPNLQSIRKPQGIRISGFGSFVGVAGAKQLKIRLGGVLIGSVSITATTTGSFRFDSDILFFAPAVQRGGITVSPHQSTIYSNYVATTVDMMVSDQVIQFEVQLVNAADSIVIDGCVFEVIG